MRLLRVLLAIIAICAAAAATMLLFVGPPGMELGTLWHRAAPESLNLTQAVTQRYVHPAAWTHVLLPVLLAPAALVFAAVAIAALLPWTLLWRRHRSKAR